MRQVPLAAVAALLLTGVFGCTENAISPDPQETQANAVNANARVGGYAPTPGGQQLPYPTIISQTFIPPYELFAHTKCHTWRIEWPNYPAGTDPNTIPTVFRLSNGGLFSFDYLNATSPSNTYKTNFNLYHNAQIEMSRTLWDELNYSFGAGDQMEPVWFNKVNISVKSLEFWVKERPSLFETNWVDNSLEPPLYQQGDIFLFKLMDQNRYGGIRIVSMTPRIIEVYLAVPNN